MDKVYGVSFVMDHIVVIANVAFPPEITDEEYIAKTASAVTLDNYGFNPLELCYDYEVYEV